MIQGKFPSRYLVLAPVDSHRQSLLITTSEDPHLEELPLYSALLKLFLKSEVSFPTSSPRIVSACLLPPCLDCIWSDQAADRACGDPM